MSDIFKYIKKYKDIDIKDMPLNEIDMLILSQISYINFEFNNRCHSSFINLEEFEENIDELVKNTLYVKRNKKLYLSLLNTKRYESLEVGYVDILMSKEIQYCALSFKLDDNIFITFRGTDTSISGWKEDLNLAIYDEIPSHIKGLEYTQNMILNFNAKFYLLGHSKGGNIAIFSAIKLEDNLKDKVIGIYDFDGPGFKYNIYNSDGYLNIKDKYHKYIPQDDIIGGLLVVDSINECIIKSSSISILQHDLYSWKIKDNHFEYLDKLTHMSNILNESATLWLNEMTDEEKYNIVSIIFRLFDDARIVDFNQFKKNPFKTAKDLIISYKISLSDKDRKILKSILSNFLKSSFKITKNTIKGFIKREA